MKSEGLGFGAGTEDKERRGLKRHGLSFTATSPRTGLDGAGRDPERSVIFTFVAVCNAWSQTQALRVLGTCSAAELFVSYANGMLFLDFLLRTDVKPAPSSMCGITHLGAGSVQVVFKTKA